MNITTISSYITFYQKGTFVYLLVINFLNVIKVFKSLGVQNAYISRLAVTNDLVNVNARKILPFNHFSDINYPNSKLS